LQEFALTPSGTDVFAVVTWDELILDEKVAATPRNYRSSGCDMRRDLLKCCSQRISLNIQLGGERKVTGVGEIILMALDMG
jgi:hypothetical protein